MLLAELEVFHTRPAVPTRRVALGHLVLPVDPAPGFGGLLLGAVVANHIGGVDDELLPDIARLINQVERGDRVVQPRLRHRYQADRHGLSHSRHRLVGEDDDIVERLEIPSRRLVAPVLQKATRWRGPIGPALIAFLAGSRATELSALADPRGWALQVLGFSAEQATPSGREITKQYRARMRDVHPDHGGDRSQASKAILDLNEARRILGTKGSG
jgi:hypothetical protein